MCKPFILFLLINITIHGDIAWNMFWVLFWQLFVKMHVMIGISVFFGWLLDYIWQKYHPSSLKSNFQHMGGVLLIFVSPPDKAFFFFFRLVWNMFLKWTQMLLNIDFCSPEPKMTWNIKIGPDLWFLDQKL